MNRILWNFKELFTTWYHTAPPILNFYPHDFGVSQSKTRTLPLRHMGGGYPSLIRYSSKTAEQNFMKLSGIVHYMMPYCTSYFKFLFEWFWGFPAQNKDFAMHTKHGGAGGYHFVSIAHSIFSYHYVQHLRGKLLLYMTLYKYLFFIIISVRHHAWSVSTCFCN